MSKVTGYRETARALRTVAKFPAKQVGQASRKALTPIMRAAKAGLKAQGSYKRGVLFRSLRIRKLKRTTSLSSWVASATGRGVGIAHLVEAGTDKHYQPRRKQMHPGAKAKPFLEPAYFENDEKAIRIMTRELGNGLIRHASKTAYRGRK